MIVYTVTIAAMPLVSPKPLKVIDWLSGGLAIAFCLWAMTQADTKTWLTLLPLSLVGAVLYAATGASKHVLRSRSA
jgi:hypothetical protein